MRQNTIYKLATASAWAAALAFPAVSKAACDPSLGIIGGVECFAGGSPVTLPEAIQIIVNTLLFIVGVAAVIMLIIGGMRYVFSGGNPQNTKAAKDTILYAVIGIVVALLAYAIVNFVVQQFS